MRRNGYDSYHGRRRGRTVLLILITALLIILMLSLAALFFLEPYIHYSSDGVRIDLPPLFQKTEDDNPPDSTAPLQFTTPTPDPSATATPEAETQTTFRGVELSLSDLTGGTAQTQAESAGAAAAIFALKDTDGELAYQSQQSFAQEYDLNAADGAVNQAIQQANGGELYTVAYLSCFRDDILPQWNRSLSVHSSGGNYWDDEGVRWTSPASAEVRQYVTGLCQEAAALGFDELLLDNCGFPTRGNLDSIKGDSNYNSANLTADMTTFFQQLETALAGYPELKVSVVTSLSVLNGTSDGSGLTLDLLKQYADRVFVAVPDGQTLPTIEGLEIVPIVAQGTGEGSWAVLR